jgi:NNP family nitrate/nitrite transporter-like MFS transporter
MYWVFGGMSVAMFLLAMPNMRIAIPTASGTDYQLTLGLNVWLFTALLLVVAVGMGIGKAAVYKYIPDYFPKNVGAVGGLVGMLGAMGGFMLPPLFAYLEAFTGLPQATFFTLFVVTALSLLWLHVTVLRLLREEASHVRHEFDLPPVGGFRMGEKHESNAYTGPDESPARSGIYPRTGRSPNAG